MLDTMLSKEGLEDFMMEAYMVIFISSKMVISCLIYQDGNGKLDSDEFVKMMKGY